MHLDVSSQNFQNQIIMLCHIYQMKFKTPLLKKKKSKQKLSTISKITFNAVTIYVVRENG